MNHWILESCLGQGQSAIRHKDWRIALSSVQFQLDDFFVRLIRHKVWRTDATERKKRNLLNRNWLNG
jgi:hypothetical protein